MKLLKYISVLLILVSFAGQAKSQGSAFIHAGTAIPIGEFGSNDIYDEDAGGAEVGLNFGMQYVFAGYSGVGLFVGVDINYNWLQSSVKDDVKDLYEDIGLINPDINFYKFINVPITAGLNYTYQADNKLAVFLNAGVTYNVLKVTDMKISANSQTVTTEFNTAENLGYVLGGGIILNKRTTITLSYLGLGKHDIEGEVRSAGSSEDMNGEFKIDFLTLTVGLKF